MDAEQAKIWIQIRFNSYNQLDGCDEFVNELEKICPVQRNEEWYPSACSGMEFVLKLFINGPIGAFISDIVLPGLAWDVTKVAFFKIHHLFKVFLDKNEGFDLQKLEFTFDDIALRFNSIESYSALLNFYHILPEHLREMKKLKINDITKIELPLIEATDEETGERYYRYPYLGCPKEEFLWKVTYYKGFETCYYKPSIKKIL